MAAKKKITVDVDKMTPEEAAKEAANFLKSLEEHYKDVPEAEIERGAKRVQDFLDGNIQWAELLNVSPDLLFHAAEYGFTQFKQGRYDDAERTFKALVVFDRTNAYYHSVLGSILQKQRRFAEAIVEYEQALELDPSDIVSYTNRGEIFMQHGLYDEAVADFSKAMELDPDEKDKFANRARLLMKEIEKKKK